MKALVFRELKKFPLPEDFNPGGNQYKENTVELEILASGMNRRDYYITQGLYPGIKNNTILGSDGIGIHNGNCVLINPNIQWGDDKRVQSNAYEVLGMPKHGTFAERITVPEHRLHIAPEHLTIHEAAALPLGGMTAWRAVTTKAQISEGDTVLISGVGGGVAQLALQFACAKGAKVFVTSGSQDKIDKAIELGAESGVNYKDEDWSKQLKDMAGGFDAIIDSAGGPGFKNFINISNPGGRIVFYGGTLGKITEINPQIIFWRQLSILGTTMATDQEFSEMLDFVVEHKIRPLVAEVFSMEESERAFDLLGSGSPFGKLVFDHGR